MKRVLSCFALVVLALVAGPALAGKGGPPPPDFEEVIIGEDKESEDQFYAGLNWQFGSKSHAEFVIGFRSVDVKSGGDVKGAAVDLTFPIGDGFKVGELRLKAVNGEEDWQGELGLGWSFAQEGFLFTGGVQGNYINLGADFVFNGGGFQPYLGINSIGEYDRPDYLTELVGSCPSPYVYDPDSESCVFDGGEL